MELSRTTLPNWGIQCSQTWLKPLYKHMKQLLEQAVIHADEKSRKDYRQNVVWPLLGEHFVWLNTVHPEKGSKLEDSVQYSMNQKQQLMALLDSGAIPISNNLAENASGPLPWDRRPGCFATRPKEPMPVRLYTP